MDITTIRHIRDGWTALLGDHQYTSFEIDTQAYTQGDEKVLGTAVFWKRKGEDGVALQSIVREFPTGSLTRTDVYALGKARSNFKAFRERGSPYPLTINQQEHDSSKLPAMVLYRSLEIEREQADLEHAVNS